MSRIARTDGFTLTELLVVVALLSALLMVALPAARRALEIFAVRSARETLTAAATRTRSLALNHDGAQLQIDAPNATLTLSTGDSARIDSWNLRDLHGVTVTIEHSARTTGTIVYDRLGVGRLANLTVRLTRGEATGGVTFSAYGRPRAW